MSRKKKSLAIVAVMALCMSLFAGCGNTAEEKKEEAPATEAVEETKEKAEEKKEEAPAEEAGDVKIDVIAKGFQHQFWKAVEQGTKQAADEFGVEVTFQGPDNESAIAQQIEYLNAAIANQPNAICLAALDTEAAIPSIEEAQSENIPIIGFDSGVPGAPEGAIKANASTNNYAAGELAAEETYNIIKDQIKDGVRIGVVAQESNSQSIVERTQGFIDKMLELIGEDKVSVEGHDKFKKENADGTVIIDVGIPAEVKDADAALVASALLEKDDLIAIYGSNEFASNAIITANEGLDKIGEGKIVAVGFDAGKKLLDAVRDKLFVGAVTQDPVQIGYQAVKLAYEAQKGETVEDVDTGALWYNADNMEDENIKPCLYE